MMSQMQMGNDFLLRWEMAFAGQTPPGHASITMYKCFFWIILRAGQHGVDALVSPAHAGRAGSPRPTPRGPILLLSSCGAGGCHGSACSSSPLGRELSYATSSIKTRAATLPQWVSSLGSSSRRMKPVRGRTARVTPQGHPSTRLPAASTSPGSDAAALWGILGGLKPTAGSPEGDPRSWQGCGLCQLRGAGQALPQCRHGGHPAPSLPQHPTAAEGEEKHGQ